MDPFGAEDAAIGKAEDHRRTAHGQPQAGAAGKAPPQQQRGQGDDQAMADVAEHGAEHDDEAQGKGQGGVDFAVAGHAIVAQERHEGSQPGRVAQGRGHLRAFLGAGVAQVDCGASGQRGGEALLQRGRLAARHPAGDGGQAAMAVQRLLRQAGIGLRMRQGQCRRSQARLMRP